MLYFAQSALALCVPPHFWMEFDEPPACLSMWQEEGEDWTEGVLAFRNECGGVVSVEANGDCEGCTFSLQLEDGEEDVVSIVEAERSDHWFGIVTSGAGAEDLLWVEVYGPRGVGPCNDSSRFLCATSPALDLRSWLRR